MKWVVLLFISMLSLTFVSCATSTPVTSGGSISIEEYLQNQDGSQGPIKSKFAVDQPQNPKGNASLNLERSPDGTISVRSSTGNSYDITDVPASIARVKLLYVPIFLGGLLIIGGVLSFIWANKKVGLILAGSGAAVLILTYVLAQYTVIFLIGIGLVAALAFAWLIWDNKIFKRANVEHVALVDTIKPELSPELKEKFFGDRKNSTTGIAGAIQSDTTVKLVKEIRS